MGENNNTGDFVKVDTHWGCFGIGEKVFAYWKGRTAYSTGYYSGTIVKKGVLNTYNIHFDDDTVSNTSEVQILPIRVLGVGVKVYYLPDESLSGPISALIIGQKFDPANETDAQYVIQPYGSTSLETCERRQIYLAQPQAKELRRKYDSVQPKFGDVNLDNVVSGPRRRGRVSESAVSSESISADSTSPKSPPNRPKKSKSSPTARIPKQQRKTPSKKRASLPSRISDNDSVDEPMPKLQLQPDISQDKKAASFTSSPVSSAITKGAKPKVQTVKSAVENHTAQKTVKQQQLSSNVNQKTTTQEGGSLIGQLMENLNNNNKSNASNPQDDTSSKSPQKKEQFFRGYFFFLTSGDRELIKGVGNFSKEVTKVEMLRMIQRHGGKELISVGDEKGKAPDRVFLLASSHLRTLKYLYCVASGIPCISQGWIQDCVVKNEVVDWNGYRLSPGWSVQDMSLIPVHNNYPLENMKIGLSTFKAETIDTWQKLIPAAKGSVFISKDFYYDRQPAELKVPGEWLNGKIDILVSDFFCPKDTMDLLKAKGIPLVKIEWLVQTILMGKKADLKVGEVAKTSSSSTTPIVASNNSQQPQQQQ